MNLGGKKKVLDSSKVNIIRTFFTYLKWVCVLLLFIFIFQAFKFSRSQPIPVRWTEFKNDSLGYSIDYPNDLAVSYVGGKDSHANYMSFYESVENRDVPSIAFNAMSDFILTYDFANASDFITTYKQALELFELLAGKEVSYECNIFTRIDDYSSASGVIWHQYSVRPLRDDCASHTTKRLEVRKDDKVFFFNLNQESPDSIDTMSNHFYPIIDRFKFI